VFRSAAHAYTCLVVWKSEGQTVFNGKLLGKCFGCVVQWWLMGVSRLLRSQWSLALELRGLTSEVCVRLHQVQKKLRKWNSWWWACLSARHCLNSVSNSGYFHSLAPLTNPTQRRSLLHCIIPYDYALLAHVLSVNWCRLCRKEVCYMHCRCSVCH
jgi:hypothetical protein